MMRAGDALHIMRTLPVAPLATILGGRAPLILAPHPDDESLGCGGLIAEACRLGLMPYVLLVTDGTGSHPCSRLYPPARLWALRETEARAAVAALGLPAGRLGSMGWRDTAAPNTGPDFDTAVGQVAAALARTGCGIVLAPWRHDPHCDHEAVHLMAVAAASIAGVPHLAYPVWGWTLADDIPLAGPVPAGHRLDITRHLPAKRRAIAAHASQHGRVIPDDPKGFILSPDLLAMFDEPYETILTLF